MSNEMLPEILTPGSKEEAAAGGRAPEPGRPQDDRAAYELGVVPCDGDARVPEHGVDVLHERRPAIARPQPPDPELLPVGRSQAEGLHHYALHVLRDG